MEKVKGGYGGNICFDHEGGQKSSSKCVRGGTGRERGDVIKKECGRD